MKTKPFDLDHAVKHPEDVRWYSNNEWRAVRVIHAPEASEYNRTICIASDGCVWTFNVTGHFSSNRQAASICLIDAPIAPGHNPAQLRESQVGEGWKLIASPDEKPHPKAELWKWAKKQWGERIAKPDDPYTHGDTYRIPIEPTPRPWTFEYVAALLQNATGPLLVRLVQYPGEVSVLLRTGTKGVIVAGPGAILYDRLATNYEYYDRASKTWRPCTQ